ncbi:MAG: M4 family metallopeptidase [Bacteroidetes bacterium]|nr:M4 family metallopeptidase [Bacteroidota bacterium]
MKNQVRILITFILLLLSSVFYAQNQGLTNNPSSLPDDLSELVSSESTDGWVYLKDTMYVHPDSLFTKYKSYWGLGNYDSIVKTEVMTDEIGGQHYTFKQYHKGLEVYPMVVRVHDYIGKGLVINGNFVAGLRIDTAGIKTPTEIIAAAKNEINATLYTWEDSASQANLKQATGNSNATYYPSPKLLIFQKNIGTDNHYEDGFSLAYRTSIASLLPHKDEVSVFSNASNGNTIYIDAQKCYDKNPVHLPHYSKKDSINVLNDIQTKTLLTYVGNPVFHVSNVNSDLHLIDTASPIDIYALNLNSSHANETFISPTYDTTSPIVKRYAASAIWSTENYEKMMLQYFGNSYLNEVNNHHYFSGAYISGFVYLIDTNGTDSTTGYRAGINGQFFNIGSKVVNGSKIMNSSLDIIGHELTHAITFFKRNLQLIQEPGALGESYSDIFSFALQEYMRPKTGLSRNWLFGNLYESGGYRDMKNPPAKGHPDYYYGPNYIPTICCKPNAFNDACGVHVNAGVQNKWFYLLTQGDTLTRSNIFYKINPIGLDTLLNIVYKTMTEYLIPDMLFIDSRRASIDIAKKLYPAYIANNIAKAWDAVGVIDTFTTATVIEIGPFTDTTQISWHKDSTITKSLIINDNAVVIIENDTINMPRNSKIIVKHGGKLIIRNSLIRGFYSCQNSKWDGIEVESGTNGTNYVENSKGNSLLEISKSTISFAKCGIRSGKNSDILNFNDHGGLISLFKTEFRGCDTSIIFYNDANKSNFLNIDSCFFNGQEPGNNDPKQANDHHILIYSAVNLNAHIDTLTAPIDPVFSIKITRSRFENCFNSYIHSYEKCNFGEVPTYQVECLIIKGIEINESYFLMNKKENFIHLSNINNLRIRKSNFTFACETSTPLYIKNWKK